MLQFQWCEVNKDNFQYIFSLTVINYTKEHMLIYPRVFIPVLIALHHHHQHHHVYETRKLKCLCVWYAKLKQNNNFPEIVKKVGILMSFFKDTEGEKDQSLHIVYIILTFSDHIKKKKERKIMLDMDEYNDCLIFYL